MHSLLCKNLEQNRDVGRFKTEAIQNSFYIQHNKTVYFNTITGHIKILCEKWVAWIGQAVATWTVNFERLQDVKFRDIKNFQKLQDNNDQE